MPRLTHAQRRKASWFKLSDLEYAEIDNVPLAARLLAEATPPYVSSLTADALHADEQLLRDVCLSVLRADDLRALLRDAHHTPAAGRALSSLKLEDLHAELGEAARCGQRDLRGRRLLPSLVWRALSGTPLVRICPDALKVFVRYAN